jgi:hypothetical protein
MSMTSTTTTPSDEVMTLDALDQLSRLRLWMLTFTPTAEALAVDPEIPARAHALGAALDRLLIGAMDARQQAAEQAGNGPVETVRMGASILLVGSWLPGFVTRADLRGADDLAALGRQVWAAFGDFVEGPFARQYRAEVFGHADVWDGWRAL